MKTKNYYSYQCPAHIQKRLASIAMNRRKTNGEDVSWSKVLREILDNGIEKLSKK